MRKIFAGVLTVRQRCASPINSCQFGADKQFVEVTTAWRHDDSVVASWSENAPPTCVDRERLCKSVCREYLRLPAHFDCLRLRQPAVGRVLIGACERDSVVSTKYRRKVSKRLSGNRTRKLSPSVHSSGSNTQPSKRSNGLADGASCATAAVLRQRSTIKRGNIDL